MSAKIEINWEDDYLKRWLANRNPKTVKNYKIAMKLFLRFTGMTPSELIQEKYNDMQKPPYEQGVVEDMMKSFNQYLLREYVTRLGKKGLAPKSALTYCASVADFFSSFKMMLNLNWSEDFPASSLGRNDTEKMTAEQIEMLASYAPTVRDKALIWIMFQSGIDVSQVCKLTWGQVEKELLNLPTIDDYPTIMLRKIKRLKEPGRTFNTLFGKTAIHYLKLSLEKTYGKDYHKKLNYDSPLFIGRARKPEKRKQHKPRFVQEMMRKIAPDSGIAGTRFEAADMNPLSPRSLRASFADQMAKAGASQILVDYLQGHKMKYGTAYFGGEEGLREAYVKYAKEVLEPQRIKSSQEMQAQIDKLNRRIDELHKELEEDREELKKSTEEIEETRELHKETKEMLKEIETLVGELKRKGFIKD